LIVENLGLTEDYTRVKFTDIRYIVAFTTPGSKTPYLVAVLVGIGLMSYSLFFISVPGVTLILFSAGALVLFGIPATVFLRKTLRPPFTVKLGTDVSLIPIPIPRTPSGIPAFVSYLQEQGALQENAARQGQL
jgi:hypothetical protein